MTRVRRAVATATVLLIVGTVAPGVAYAVTHGVSGATYETTSGSWRASPSTSIFTLLAPLTPPAPQYTTISNNGTLDLIGATYDLDVVGLTAGTVSLKACSGTWNETADTCSGSTTTIVTSASPTTDVTTAGLFPAAVNEVVRLQVSLDAPTPSPVG